MEISGILINQHQIVVAMYDNISEHVVAWGWNPMLPSPVVAVAPVSLVCMCVCTYMYTCNTLYIICIVIHSETDNNNNGSSTHLLSGWHRRQVYVDLLYDAGVLPTGLHCLITILAYTAIYPQEIFVWVVMHQLHVCVYMCICMYICIYVWYIQFCCIHVIYTILLYLHDCYLCILYHTCMYVYGYTYISVMQVYGTCTNIPYIFICMYVCTYMCTCMYLLLTIPSYFQTEAAERGTLTE